MARSARVMSSLLALWMLLALFLSGNSLAHRFLHEDAHTSTHQCPITLIDHQKVLPSDPAVTPVRAVVLRAGEERLVLRMPAARLVISEGPPRAPPV